MFGAPHMPSSNPGFLLIGNINKTLADIEIHRKMAAEQLYADPSLFKSFV